MKKIPYTLLIFCLAGLYSCRKSNADIDIKTYDQQQIQNYISANGLTGYTRDLSGGDTTGIYYKIISKGTGAVIDYPTLTSLVFTVTSFDGSLTSQDTIINHVYNYVGHLNSNFLPKGVQLALINILKTKGTRASVIIPSHLGYGTNGTAFNGGGRINGNQCLDYYINVVNNDPLVDPVTGKTVIDPTSGLAVTGQDKYDDISVQNYITANALTGFTKTASGLYYKVTSPAQGATAVKTSLVTIQYTGTLFNGIVTSDSFNSTTGDGAVIDLENDTRRGLVEACQLAPVGSQLTVLMPSRLAYSFNGYTADSSIPSFSCLRYDINLISIQ